MNEGKINYERDINELLFNSDILVRKLQEGKYLNSSDRDLLLNTIGYIEQLKKYGNLLF